MSRWCRTTKGRFVPLVRNVEPRLSRWCRTHPPCLSRWCRTYRRSNYLRGNNRRQSQNLKDSLRSRPGGVPPARREGNQGGESTGLGDCTGSRGHKPSLPLSRTPDRGQGGLHPGHGCRGWATRMFRRRRTLARALPLPQPNSQPASGPPGQPGAQNRMSVLGAGTTVSARIPGDRPKKSCVPRDRAERPTGAAGNLEPLRLRQPDPSDRPGGRP